MWRFVFAIGFLWLVPAWAWPVDAVETIDVGKERVFLLSAIDWVDIENPSLLTALRTDAHTLKLSGKIPGETRLLLYGDGHFAVWNIAVIDPKKKPSVPPSDTSWADKTSCTVKNESANKWSVSITSANCRSQMLQNLQTASVLNRQMQVEYQLEALQAQVGEIENELLRLKLENIQVRYVGAGLELSGTLTHAQHRTLLWAVFRQSIGTVVLNDNIILIPETADAGKDTL